MIAGTLEIQMLANMARLAKDMGEAKSIVEKNMKGIEGAVASAKSALGALGIGLGVGYFVSLINGSITAMEHLHDLRKSTNITVEDLSGLSLAAKQSGSDLESVAFSINKLSTNMGKDPEKFKALGISAKEPLEAFKQLADIYNSLDDPQQRAAVAAAALGRSWAGAAPLLAEGSKRIAEMVENGKRLSGITGENAEQADKWKDQMAELNVILGATKNKIVGDALPTMGEISRAMNEAAKEGGLLLTVWVGLGGALAAILGQTDAQQTKKRLGEINEQLALANKQIQAGSLKPPGAVDSFWSFLIPDKVLDGRAIAAIKATIATLEAEKERLSPSKKVNDGMDDEAIASIIRAEKAAEKAKKFLGEKGLYEANVAAIKGYVTNATAAIRTGSTLIDLAWKEAGINTQRTQEELLLAQSAQRDKDLRQQLDGQIKLRDLAKNKGPDKAKDFEAASADIIRINAAIVDNETLTQAQIRTARAVTAQQGVDQYNSWLEGQINTGSALADSLRGQAEVENKAYQTRLGNLNVYLSSAQGQIADSQALTEQLKAQHEFNMFMIEKNKNEAVRSMQINTWQLAAELLQTFAGKSKEAAIAVIVINKALAIAQVIMNTQVAVMRAYAELGPYAGSAMAGYLESLQAVQIGLIVATGLGQAASVGKGGAAPGTASNPQSVFQAPQANLGQQAAGPMNTTIIHFNAADDDVLSGKFMRNILTKLEEATRDGGRVVVAS